MCYISGGRPAGADRNYKGCRNRSAPEKSKPIKINAELYFARRSKTWQGGGVAFINPEADRHKITLGRMYLITKEQFTELVKQESRYEEELLLDLEKAIEQGSVITDIPSWYGKLLFLGQEEDYPIFSFTNEHYLAGEVNPPAESYLQIIRRGLEETYCMKRSEIDQYLADKKGVGLLSGQ